jgi:hypothetical protein
VNAGYNYQICEFLNVHAKRTRIMLSDISEVLTFAHANAA